MNTKNALFFLGLCTSTLIWSGDMGIVKPAFNGFYVGGALGPTYVRAHENIAASVTAELGGTGVGDLSAAAPLSFQSDMSKTSLIGTLFGGYARTWNERYYLGGEIAVTEADYGMSNKLGAGVVLSIGGFPISLADASITTHSNISPTQFTAAIRPGYLLTPTTLGYGRVGIAVARTSFSALSNATLLGLNSTLTPSANRFAGFFQTGGGLEQKINEHWTARVDYIYTNYGQAIARQNVTANTNFDILGTVSPVTLVVTGNNHIKYYDQSVFFGLTYQFA